MRKTLRGRLKFSNSAVYLNELITGYYGGRTLIIHDVVTEFIEHYEPSIGYLEQYFERNPQHFEEYYKYHCLNKEEKMKNALSKHQMKLSDINQMKLMMPSFIHEITKKYVETYLIHFTQDVHLLVGIYGSNAYTYRQYNPEIAFCLERLSSKEDHFKAIIAHELFVNPVRCWTGFTLTLLFAFFHDGKVIFFTICKVKYPTRRYVHNFSDCDVIIC